jgi:hypothetical protein
VGGTGGAPPIGGAGGVGGTGGVGGIEPNCGEWPPDQGYFKDLFVDGGVRLTGNSNDDAAAVLGLSSETMLTDSQSTQDATIIGSFEDANGALLYPDHAPRFRMVYVNGGSAGGHGTTLGEEGLQRFRDFYYNGGSYTGSCAGAYIFTTIPSLNYFDIWPNMPTHDGGFTTNVNITFHQTDHPMVQKLVELHGSTLVTGVRFIGGPMFDLDQAMIDIGTEYFGTIDADNNNVDLEGSNFIIAWKKDENSGRAVIQIGHPEYDYNLGQRFMMASEFWYALEGQARTPKIKATLTNNAPYTAGPGQEVGDNQYHRFLINVPEGATSLDIQLNGFSENLELYVHPSCPAHVGTAPYRSENLGVDPEGVLVQNPEPGDWNISVKGAHMNRNGSVYTLNAIVQ